MRVVTSGWKLRCLRPFNRMSQHLGRAVNSSVLRNHLAHGADPEECKYRLVAYGPILPEVAGKDMLEHKVSRDTIAALERQLAHDLHQTGYKVLNTVSSKKTLDPVLYRPARAAFAAEFPLLDPP